MRPLCGIQHGENRKSQKMLSFANGKGQHFYASFPDLGQSPNVSFIQKTRMLCSSPKIGE